MRDYATDFAVSEPTPPSALAIMGACTLIIRYSIEDITAPAGVLAPSLKRAATNCDLHRPGRSALLAHKLGAGNAATPRNRQSRWKSARWLVALRTGCIMSEVPDTAKCPCAETGNIAGAAFVTRRERKSFATASTLSSNTVMANCLSAVFSAEHVR